MTNKAAKKEPSKKEKKLITDIQESMGGTGNFWRILVGKSISVSKSMPFLSLRAELETFTQKIETLIEKQGAKNTEKSLVKVFKAVNALSKKERENTSTLAKAFAKNLTLEEYDTARMMQRLLSGPRVHRCERIPGRTFVFSKG